MLILLLGFALATHAQYAMAPPSMGGGCGGGCASTSCGAPLPMPCARPCPAPQPCPMQVCPPPPLCPPPPPPPPCPAPPPPPMCPPRPMCPPPPTPMCPRPICAPPPPPMPCPCSANRGFYDQSQYFASGGFASGGFGFGSGSGGCGGGYGGGCSSSQSYYSQAPMPLPSGGGGCGGGCGGGSVSGGGALSASYVRPGGGGCGGGGNVAQPLVPAQNDCCCGCRSPCKYRRRKAFGAKTRGTDPSCNSQELRTIMTEHITDDTSDSKRRIQKAAQNNLGGLFDVVCGRGEYSYIAHTELFCQASKNDVTCYAFRPL